MTYGEAMAVAALALAVATVAAVRRLLEADLEPVATHAAVTGLIVSSVSEAQEIGVSAAMGQWRTEIDPVLVTPAEHDRLERAVTTVMESDDLDQIANTLATVARSETVAAAARAYTAASITAAEDALAEQHEAQWWDRLLASWPDPANDPDPEITPESYDDEPGDDDPQDDDDPEPIDWEQWDREIEAQVNARPDTPDDDPEQVSYRLVWATDADPCDRCVERRGTEIADQESFRRAHIGCGCYAELEIKRGTQND